MRESYVDKIHDKLHVYTETFRSVKDHPIFARFFNTSSAILREVAYAASVLETIHPMSAQIRERLRPLQFKFAG